MRPPQLPGLFEAPITATDSGSKRLFQTSSGTNAVLLSEYGRLMLYIKLPYEKYYQVWFQTVKLMDV